MNKENINVFYKDKKVGEAIQSNDDIYIKITDNNLKNNIVEDVYREISIGYSECKND